METNSTFHFSFKLTWSWGTSSHTLWPLGQKYFNIYIKTNKNFQKVEPENKSSYLKQVSVNNIKVGLNVWVNRHKPGLAPAFRFSSLTSTLLKIEPLGLEAAVFVTFLLFVFMLFCVLTLCLLNVFICKGCLHSCNWGNLVPAFILILIYAFSSGCRILNN